MRLAIGEGFSRQRLCLLLSILNLFFLADGAAAQAAGAGASSVPAASDSAPASASSVPAASSSPAGASSVPLGSAISGSVSSGSVPTAPAFRPAIAAPPGRALLISGPEPRRGLPFFSPNAIPCLYGEYLVGTELVPLYYTKAALVLSESWIALEGRLWPSSSRLRGYSLSRDGAELLLLSSDRFHLFFVLKRNNAQLTRFALALERRFNFFFDNAPSEAELSFPASVEFSP